MFADEENTPEFQSIVKLVESNPAIGIDVADYGAAKNGIKCNFSQAFVRWCAGLNSNQKTMHFNACACPIEARAEIFQRDIEFAVAANIRRAVLHLTEDYPTILPDISAVHTELSKFEPNGIVPYIENLAFDFDYFSDLIELAKKTGCPFGICMDVGHANVWGNATENQWLNLLSEVQDFNIPIVFHVHANDGVKDRHWALWENEGLHASGFEHGLSGFAKRIHTLFPESPMIFENSIKLAQKSLDFMSNTMPLVRTRIRPVA
jgi:hypothetical protein